MLLLFVYVITLLLFVYADYAASCLGRELPHNSFKTVATCGSRGVSAILAPRRITLMDIEDEEEEEEEDEDEEEEGNDEEGEGGEEQEAKGGD
jgi:hypothetical protein